MTHVIRNLKFAVCLAVLSAVPAFAQIAPEEATPDTAAASVAHVYVQTTNGVNGYNAAANGKLTLIGGSPFKPQAR